MWFNELCNWINNFEKDLENENPKVFSLFAYNKLDEKNFFNSFDVNQFLADFYKVKDFPKQFKPNSQFGNPPP